MKASIKKVLRDVWRLFFERKAVMSSSYLDSVRGVALATRTKNTPDDYEFCLGCMNWLPPTKFDTTMDAAGVWYVTPYEHSADEYTYTCMTCASRGIGLISQVTGIELPCAGNSLCAPIPEAMEIPDVGLYIANLVNGSYFASERKQVKLD